MTDIVFMDTETLGLDIDAPIWEFAAIRRQPDGTESQEHLFIRHDPYPWLDYLDEPFAEDYVKRYDPLRALRRWDAALRILDVTHGAHIVGAVPNFDTERITKLVKSVGTPKWHYHLIDVENLAVGYLARRAHETPKAKWINEVLTPPWKSDELSAAIGVDPQQFDRHTAMGDVKWCMAQWDAIMGGAHEQP